MSGLDIGNSLYKLEPVVTSDQNVEILEKPFADGNPDHFTIKPVSFSGSIGQAMSPLTKLNATMNQYIVSGFRAKVHDMTSGVIYFSLPKIPTLTPHSLTVQPQNPIPLTTAVQKSQGQTPPKPLAVRVLTHSHLLLAKMMWSIAGKPIGSLPNRLIRLTGTVWVLRWRIQKNCLVVY
jgi:hypothetical protein